jgi:large subunit ribosomal protein L25
MAEIALVAQAGRPTGSRAAGRLRAAGQIPGVLYGHGTSPTPVAVEGRALRNALMTDAGLNALLELDLAGTKHLAMARELQRDPVRHSVMHVDFVIVRRDEVISADVNISLVGEALQVHREDGVVDQSMFSISVRTTPGRIPPSIDVDISDLAIGDTIRVGDLKLPDGVTTEVDPEEAVVIGQPPQVTAADLVTEADAEAAEAAEAAAEEAGEGAEGATAEGGGEAPAEGGGGDAPAESSEG